MMFIRRYEAAILRKVEGSISFAILTIAIRQFAYKMCSKSSLGPRFAEVHADRSRRSADLTGECISFFRREPFTNLVYLHGKLIGCCVDTKFLCRLHSHRSHSSSL